MKKITLIPQAACVPFRFGPAGTLQVLLIRWNDSDQWGIPKGQIEEENTARQTALIEAYEEAGLRGDLLDKDLGMFDYEKGGNAYRVRVYALHVREELNDYDEKGARERRWFSIEAAQQNVARPPVKDMIALLLDRARWLAG